MFNIKICRKKENEIKYYTNNHIDVNITNDKLYYNNKKLKKLFKEIKNNKLCKYILAKIKEIKYNKTYMENIKTNNKKRKRNITYPYFMFYQINNFLINPNPFPFSFFL